MRIRFESDNGLPLNKILNIPASVIIVRPVFEERNGKSYPQVHLNNCCIEYDHSYACPKIPLKCVNNFEYGKYLF